MGIFNSRSNRLSRISIIAFASFVACLLLLVFFGGPPASLTAKLHGSTSRHENIGPARKHSLDAVQNATLGFEKILAINLPERTDYRDGLTLAGAVSNIKIDIIDGVHGDEVLEKVLPPIHRESPEPSLKGSWRAHLNAIQRVVENNWTTALIFESDVDWDVRVKDILSNIALATEATLLSPADRPSELSEISFLNAIPTSPYGDGWDILWLGHCGMQIKHGSAVIVMKNDDTVPEAQFVRTWDSEEKSPLENYSLHSRIVFKSDDCVCTIAYAVTQQGARQLLNSLGLHRMNGPFDIMLREWCAGDKGDDQHVCLGTLPPAFAAHKPAGSTAGDSDMAVPAEGFRDRGFTQNIRWSVRMNMDKILRGDTDYEDQFPDTVPVR